MNIAPALYKRIIAGKLYMDKNFRESIDLNSISREACISRYHFHRLFTRVYRKTPHQYLTIKRIDLACELLTDERLSVTDVCNAVGFESMGSFSVLFKKEIGMNPSTFRNNAVEKKEQSKNFPTSFIPHCFINTYRGLR